MNLSSEETQRYSRQLLIPAFGLEGQLKLKRSRVLVIGAGGLGSPILLYLASAGIGTIGIVENDTVALSNLQRQILYTTASTDNLKIDEAEARLLALNPEIIIEKHTLRLTSSNALDILQTYDVVVDGSDNFPTRYLINDACVILNKPFVYGAIYRFEGQVAVFNYKNSATYRDLFPEPPNAEMAPNCAEAGVLGVMAGIIGSLQANETIKLIAEIGEPLAGKVLLIDTLSMAFRTLKIPKIPSSQKITQLIDYESFCGISIPHFQSISHDELRRWVSEERDFQLVDVREANEYAQQNLGGELMPLSSLASYVAKISRTKPVVVHCQSGKRSLKAIQILQENYDFTNLFNLEKGMG